MNKHIPIILSGALALSVLQGCASGSNFDRGDLGLVAGGAAGAGIGAVIGGGAAIGIGAVSGALVGKKLLEEK